MNTKDLVSIETLSSLFLSLSTGGGWKRFWDGQNFLFEPMEEFCYVRWWLCFCLCSASDWGPSSSLFGGVCARERHTCAGWRTCVEVWTTWHTRPSISHTNQKWDRKVRKTRRTNWARDKEGKTKVTFSRRTPNSRPFSLWTTLPLDLVFPRTTSDEDKTLTHAPFCCCHCCVPQAHGPRPENSSDT